MKVYLLNTNAGRSMIINVHNKWYGFAYAINGCDIGCDDVHEAIENLEKHVKTIYSNDDTIDISNFEHLSTYDRLNIWECIESIHDYEIEHGIPCNKQTALHFVCEV